MRRAHLVTGTFFLLVAVFLGYHATGLRYFTSLGPGPGFFPVWLCLLLGLLAAGVILQSLLAPAEALPAEFFASRPGYARIGTVLVTLLAIPLVMPTLGFRLTMFAFYVALLTLLGRRGVVETLALAALGSFGAYHLFVEFLSQPLPVGRFGI